MSLSDFIEFLFYEIPYWKLDNIEKVLEGIIKDTSSAPDMEEAQEVTEEV